MTENQKFTIQQARAMIEYNSQRLQMVQEELERVGYDIKLLQMQIKGVRNGIQNAEEKEDSHYY